MFELRALLEQTPDHAVLHFPVKQQQHPVHPLACDQRIGAVEAVSETLGDQILRRTDTITFETRADLLVLRLRFRVVRQWDALVEYRWLEVDEAETVQQGILLGVYRQIREHMKLGVGYNFTDFDDDLTRLDYESSGWFLNIVGKY